MQYFEVYKGQLNRVREWPKSLTKKRALQLSIRKWEVLSAHPGVFDGSCETCALCHLHDVNCGKCPVAIYVDDVGCSSTPYSFASGEEDYEAKELSFLKEVYLDKYGEEYP